MSELAFTHTGEPFDVPIVQLPLDPVLASGHVIAASETPLAFVAVGVAVRTGAPKPDISSADAVKRLLLGSKAIAYPNAASGAAAGVSFNETLQKLGIADAMKPKIKIAQGGRGAMELLAKGEVDIGLVDYSQVDSLRSASGLSILSVDSPGFTFYVHQLDPAKPASRFFGSRDVRRALLMALDRQGIVDAILFKQGAVADSTVPRVSWGYSKNVRPKYAFDRAGAERMLDGAGWTKGADGVRQKNGDQFRFEILYPAGVKFLEDMAASLQDQWKRIGVQATPKPGDLATVIVPAFYNTRNFDLLLTSIGLGDEPDSQSLLFSSASAAPGGANAAPFKDSRVDDLLAQGVATFDRTKRAQIYAQVQDIIMEELPAAPLVFQNVVLGVSKRVRGVRFSSVGGSSYYQGVWVTDGK